jgi:hypothetical protein
MRSMERCEMRQILSVSSIISEELTTKISLRIEMGNDRG